MMLRNVDWLRQAFELIPNWRAVLERSGPTEWSDSLDEARLSSVLSPDANARRDLAAPGTGPIPDRYWRGSLFKNQWVTPFAPSPWLDGDRRHPETWWWRPGFMSNSRDAPRDFPYLHLMNFQSGRYVARDLYGAAKTWSKGSVLVEFNQANLDKSWIEISRKGFRTLTGEVLVKPSTVYGASSSAAEND